MNTTKLTLTNEHGTYSVELNRQELNYPDFIEMVRSVALSAGYAGIDDYLAE